MPVALTVTVRDELGPVHGATVRLAGSVASALESTDRDGKAVLHVTPGSYLLTVEAKWHPSHEEQVEVWHDDELAVNLGRAFLPIFGRPDGRDLAAWLAAFGVLAIADLDGADALWRDHAPRRFRGLLANDGYAWDAPTQTYVSPNGSRVTAQTLYGLSTGLTTAVEHDLEDAAARMARGELDLGEWQRQTAATVKDLYAAQAALAVGGIPHVTPADLLSAQGSPDTAPGLQFSIGRLADFADAVAGHQPRADTEAAVVARSGAYSESGHGIYERLRTESHAEAEDAKGRKLWLYQLNVLDDGAAHCHTTEYDIGCPEVTRKGWQPIGVLPEIGARSCSFRCRCSWRFALVPDDLRLN